jgi:lipoate-protein ligase B
MMIDHCVVHWLGQVDYLQSWHLQEQLAQEISQGIRPATLLLLEHPHTYTFGRRGQAGNLLWDADELARRGVSVHWVDRGGDVTYHGPGQLVGYPLLPLTRLQAAPGGLPSADYVGYLRRLERTLITAVGKLGVAAFQVTGQSGVWVQRKNSMLKGVPSPTSQPTKLAAIGVKVDAQGVTRHGFALNVNPDMSYWQGIVACGLKDTAQTCLAELLPSPPSMGEAIAAVMDAFGKIFSCQMDAQPLTHAGIPVHVKTV